MEIKKILSLEIADVEQLSDNEIENCAKTYLEYWYSDSRNASLEQEIKQPIFDIEHLPYQKIVRFITPEGKTHYRKLRVSNK